VFAARFILLHWWAVDRAIGAKNAAIAFFGLKQDAAGLAFVKKFAGVGHHGFRFAMTTIRTS
jgi:hypothetical protein